MGWSVSADAAYFPRHNPFFADVARAVPVIEAMRGGLHRTGFNSLAMSSDIHTIQ